MQPVSQTALPRASVGPNAEPLTIEGFPPKNRAVPLADFLKQGSHDIEWLVEGLAPKNGLITLGGLPGLGKTWILLDLAIACAAGEKWLGHFNTEKVPVLYVDEESGDTLLRSRFSSLLAARKLDADSLEIHLLVFEGIKLDKPASVATLRTELKATAPGLVIFDSLIRLHSREENSASDMSGVFEVVKKLSREFGCTILFADHQRKPGPHESAPNSMQLRGSGDKAGVMDSVLMLSKNREGSLVVDHTKSRQAKALPSFLIEIKDTADGNATTVTHAGDADALRQQAYETKSKEARKFLLSSLTGGDWLSRKELIDLAGDEDISAKAVDQALKSLTKSGRVERESRKEEKGRGGKAARFRLKPTLSPSSLHNREATETESKVGEK